MPTSPVDVHPRFRRSPAPRLLALALAAFALFAAAADRAAAASLDDLVIQRSGARAGVGFYQPATWGIVDARVLNPSDEGFSALLAVTLGDRSNIQFTSELWLPANAGRQVRTPVHPIFELDPDGARVGLEVESWLIEPGDAGRAERRTPPVPAMLIVRDNPLETAIIGDGEQAEHASGLASGHRQQLGQAQAMAYLRPEHAPAFTQGFDAVGTVVLAGGEAALNANQVQALRDWVLRGGRLWINLVQVDAEAARRVLGDAMDLIVVERVRLDRLTFTDQDGDEHRLELDYPLEMVRVLAPDMEVLQQVADFPVVMRRNFGRGQVMVTTLDLSAWLTDPASATPATSASATATDDSEAATAVNGDEAGAVAGSGRVELPAQSEVLAWFFDVPAGQRQAGAAQLAPYEAYVREQIGYTILGRTPVMAVLATFALGLLVLGIVLMRRGRLEWIGAAGATGAVVAAGVLVGLGQARQSEQPTMLASAHHVEPASPDAYAAATRLISLYRPPGGPGSVDLSGPGHAIAWPDHADRTTETLRMVWQGEQRWAFPGFNLPSGAVRSLHQPDVLRLDGPAWASARLTEHGLEGRVHLPGAALGGSLADAVVATRDGHLGVRFAGDAEFIARPEDRLSPREFILGGVLQQTQQGRQAVYRQIFTDPHFPRRPTLLVWARDLEPSLDVSIDAERRSHALVMLPLRLEPPAPGARVHVPATLLAMEPYRRGPSEFGGIVFDAGRREWITPMEREESFLVAFQLPEALRAIEIEQATVQLDLQAPGWRYELVRYHAGQIGTLREGQNPLGRMRINLEGDDLPVMDGDGNLVLGLRMTRADDDGPMTGGPNWALRHIELEVTGVMPE
ncbi:MAG: hypothetical protein WD009_04530 [Phycisphaeraceae bacterium]